MRESYTRELICTSGETKTRRHDRNEIAFRDSAGLEHFLIILVLHLHFLSWMILQDTHLLRFDLSWFWTSILSTFHLKVGGVVRFLYSIHLHLWARTHCIITSRLGRSLVGFLSSNAYSGSGLTLACLSVAHWGLETKIGLLYIFIFVQDGIVGW